MASKYPEGEGLVRALQTMEEKLARDPRTSDVNTEFTWGSNDGRVVQATLVGFSRDATTDAMESVTIQPAGRQASRVPWSRLDVVSHVMAKAIIAARSNSDLDQSAIRP